MGTGEVGCGQELKQWHKDMCIASLPASCGSCISLRFSAGLTKCDDISAGSGSQPAPCAGPGAHWWAGRVLSEEGALPLSLADTGSASGTVGRSFSNLLKPHCSLSVADWAGLVEQPMWWATGWEWAHILCGQSPHQSIAECLYQVDAGSCPVLNLFLSQSTSLSSSKMA